MDHFTEIDKETWPRMECYKLYTTKWLEQTFSATMKMSVEKLINCQKAHGQKLVPALLYIFSREFSRDQAFTIAVKDGKLGYWDRIHPVYPVLNENGTFSFHTTPVRDDFGSFYDAYMREREENADKTGINVSLLFTNGYVISIMPFWPFESLSHSLKYIKNYYAPIVAIGKYDEEYRLPVAVTVNHAVCDGWHLSELFRRVQEAFDNPEEYLHG